MSGGMSGGMSAETSAEVSTETRSARITVALSLVSHTNAGKTTLARTLLAQDVGEVRDAPHVTEFADGHVLLESAQGDQLQLWDTPGFGDSVRLARRLEAHEGPLGGTVGWFLSEVWDRWTDRPFWASQQALRHVRDTSDVVLYLVNAAEAPAAAGYLAPEMRLLSWVGKPVLVLLNQLGAPRGSAAEAADVERWRQHLQTLGVAAAAARGGATPSASSAPLALSTRSAPPVQAVLPLDAFARCWVQEGALWQAVLPLLDGERAAAMQRLTQAWALRRLATFDAAVHELATSLGRIGAARATSDVTSDVAGDDRAEAASVLSGWFDRLRRLDPRAAAAAADNDPAQAALALALDEEVKHCTAALISLHGLRGEAQAEILARLAGDVQARERVPEGRAAVLGGAVTGALAGLKADVVSGGFTLGGGLIAGGILGALGAAGLARAVNVVRDTERRWVRWSDAAMAPRVQSALLRYLAVAHFGRGRGDWAAGEAPPHWAAEVQAALAPHEAALAALWTGRSTRWDNAGEAERLAGALHPLLAAAVQDLLLRLYPGCWPEATARGTT